MSVKKKWHCFCPFPDCLLLSFSDAFQIRFCDDFRDDGRPEMIIILI